MEQEHQENLIIYFPYKNEIFNNFLANLSSTE